MRDLLKKFRNGLVAGIGFIAAIALIPTGFAAISTYTGTSGSNPIQGIPGTMVDFNTLIGAVNAQLGSYLSFNTAGSVGEINLTNSASFIANGSVATAMSSVGPLGSHTTIQEWLVVLDNNGKAVYVPAF